MTSRYVFLLFVVFLSTGSFYLSDQSKSSFTPLSRKDDRVPIFFIHIGEDPEYFPDYIYYSVRQALVWNPSSDIHLVIPRVHSNRSSVLSLERDCGSSVKLWFTEDIQLTPEHSRFIKETSHSIGGFRGGFVRFTTERLFILLDIMVMLGFHEAIHLENDNLLYSQIDELLPTLKQKYPGLAVEPLGYECTAGFLYIQRSTALKDLLIYMVNHPAENEMQSLGRFIDNVGPTVMGFLPVISPDDCVGGKSEKFVTNFYSFQGLFDGAAHGQYIGGADPRNGVGGPGFVNFVPGTPFRVDDFEYKWKVDPQSKLGRYYQRRLHSISLSNGCNSSKSDHAWHPLFQLHVHCKELHKFVSFVR